MKRHFTLNVSLILGLLLALNPLLGVAFSKKVPKATLTPTRSESLLVPKNRKPLRSLPITQAEGQTGTLLPNGSWLLIGGRGPNGLKDTVVVRDPYMGETIELPAKLRIPRAGHSATMLPDGRILILGGIGANGKVVNKAEVFNSRNLNFEATSRSNFPTARAYHSATLLPDGNVLIVGGQIGDEKLEASAELWDSQTGIRVPLVNKLNTARRKHEAVLLSDGSVVIQGGVDAQGNELVAAAEVFTTATRGFNWLGVFNEQTDKRNPFLSMSLPVEDATDVPVDSKIALVFSKRLRVDSVNSETCQLIGPNGTVGASVTPAEFGRLVFLTPQEPLQSGTNYNVFVSGSVDTTNSLLTATTLTFRTAGKPEDEQIGDQAPAPIDLTDTEKWTPNPHNLKGNWRSDYPETHWQQLPPLQAPPGVTAIAGQALTIDGKPLADVTLHILGVSTRSDKTGRFLLHPVNAGHQILTIDGRTANTQTRTYGIFRVGVEVTGGKTNVLGYTCWMPRLDMEHAVNIPSPTNSELTITNPDIPGLELRLPPGTVIRGIDGETVTQISITPVPVDRPPFPLPPGINVPVFFTIQPGGAQIIPPRARVVYPNYTNERPGSRIDFWNYDPSDKGWYVYGQGTVTSDGKQVDPDPGVVIYEFSGVMINTGESPPLDGSVPCDGCEDGDPVDLGTGLFVYEKTDLYLPDVMPLSLTRTYRPQDSASRPFGIGSTHPYQMFLWSARQYREADLILPDGGRVHLERTTPGEGPRTAEFLCTTNPGPFYMAELFWSAPNSGLWHLKLRDGTIYVFGENAPLQAIIDKNGNTTTISRAGVNQFGVPIGNVTKVTSPNGKYIEFTYSGTRITKAKDNTGREVNYTYDASGRLWKVTDANNGVTEYTYDSSHRMLTVKDARGIVYLTNEYDTNGRVTKQTLADDTPATNADNPTYTFNYVTNSGGKVTQTDVTDPRGNLRRVTFNDKGYWLTNTFAVGKPEEQTTSVARQFKTNIVLSATDPQGRKTAFTYEPYAGRITTVTQLAFTAEALTTRYTYYSFSPATVTDPIGRTTSLAYDYNDTLVSVIDSLGRRTQIENNSQGQPISITDPLGNVVRFQYQAGLLVSITDQLGRRLTRTLDDAGRLVAVTNAVGQTVRFEYDGLNQLLKLTDAQNATTEFTYDPNGNRLSLKDARQKLTTYTYDNMDRPLTRTDPLQGTTSIDQYEYDLAGNLKKITDRKGKVTAYGYDNLDRLNFVGFGEMPAGVFESTTTYSYDVGDRLLTAVDSISGTIALDYDNLDRLISETNPQGALGYTYDKVGRRKTMTVSGQAVVNYDYDDGDRLTGVTQDGATVSFTYDDLDRLTTKLLPNGVAGEYDYDAASQLKGIAYRLGSSLLGDLTYEYDQLGRRVKVGGSYARTTLPQALIVAVHNDANQLTQHGTSSLTYDANGNLTGDGVSTYTWDAQNQLTAISGAGLTASFTYDAFGRRTSKTVNGATTEFLYDGDNTVQEKTGGAPSANLLTGGVDQTFTRTDSAGAHHLLTDGLGSTLGLTDGSASETTQYTYEPFGQTAASGAASGNPSQYTGRENDGTGLYYYRARYYSPTLQRFISEDPIGFGGGDANLYAYAFNSPTNYTDSSGLAVDILVDLGFIGYDIYALATGGRKDRLTNWLALGADVIGALIPVATGLGAATRAARAAGAYNDIRRVGRDAHHIIQDAAVRELPRYSRSAAPAVHLPGPSTKVGSPHYCATRVQAQRGGGTYAAERRIGYKALRKGGVSKGDSRDLIRVADDYFNGIGVRPQTPTRIPGTRY